MNGYTKNKNELRKQLYNHIGALLVSIREYRNKLVCSVSDKQIQKDLAKSVKNMNYFEVRFLFEVKEQFRNKGKRNNWAKQEFIEITKDLDNCDINKEINNIINKIYTKEKEYLKKLYNVNLTTIAIGVAPRAKPEGTSRSSTAWSYIFYDFDIDEWKNKKPSKEEINEEIEIRLKQFTEDYCKPHSIIFTGGGLRFINYIDRPISRWELPVLSKIANNIGYGADDAVYDIARVDRLPGTQNRKEKYGAPRACKIIYTKENVKPISPEVYFYKMGISNEQYKEIIKEASETTESFELINNLKKSNIKIKDFKELSKKEYQFTKFIQARLTEIYKGSGWIIELFESLGIGYKTNGKYISIYSTYYEDGANPDCTIYANKGYNARAVDWHNNNLKTNLIAYLWGAFKEDILKFIGKKGISSNVNDYIDAEDYLSDLLNNNKNSITIECEKYLNYEVLDTAIQTSIKRKEPVILQAETGRGKTYTITNNIEKIYRDNNGKITVLLFPYKSQVMQTEQQLLNKNVKVAAYYEESKTRIRDAKESALIIGTYNQLGRILCDIKYDEIDGNIIQIRDDNDIILIVDEAHNLILQKEFRRKEVNKIESYLNKLYSSVLLTATPELINLQNRQIIKATFKEKKKYFKNTHIIESRDNIQNIIDFCRYITIKFNKGSKKALVLVDSRKDIDTIEAVLKSYYFNSEIYKITKETIETDKAAQMILKSEEIPEGIVLATRIIAEGINIKNGAGGNETIQMNIREKVDVVAVLKTSSATIIRQFLARVRNGGETCIIYAGNDKTPRMLRYEKMVKIANDDFENFKEFLLSEYNKDIYKIETDLKNTKLINQLQMLKTTDEGYKVDEAKIAYYTNRKIEKAIIQNRKLLKRYLDETTGHNWEIKIMGDIQSEQFKEVLEIRKMLSEINKMEVKKLVDIIDEQFKEVDNAIYYNNYDKFSDYEKYTILRHIKMARRIIEYLKLHREYPQLTNSIIEEYGTEKDIAIKLTELNSSEWGATIKRINIAYNLCKGSDEKLGKGYIRMFETKVLEKLYKLGISLKNKTAIIREIIEEVQKECGIKLKFEEVKKIISSMYNYTSKEMKEKRENANVKVKGIDNKLEEFIKIFKTKKKDIKEEIVEKAKDGIKEFELWEYITEVLGYAEELYEKTIEKLKFQGELLEPRQGFFISE